MIMTAGRVIAGTMKVCSKEINPMSKMYVLQEFWRFVKYHKKWWLLPILVISVILGALLVLTQSSALAPFIYALF